MNFNGKEIAGGARLILAIPIETKMRSAGAIEPLHKYRFNRNRANERRSPLRERKRTYGCWNQGLVEADVSTGLSTCRWKIRETAGK